MRGMAFKSLNKPADINASAARLPSSPPPNQAPSSASSPSHIAIKVTPAEIPTTPATRWIKSFRRSAPLRSNRSVISRRKMSAGATRRIPSSVGIENTSTVAIPTAKA